MIQHTQINKYKIARKWNQEQKSYDYPREVGKALDKN
jgi:hypothetical protein